MAGLVADLRRGKRRRLFGLCHPAVPPPGDEAVAAPALAKDAQGRPTLSASNAYSCRIRTGFGSDAREYALQLKQAEAQDTAIKALQFLRWDGESRQPSAEINCVVPRTASATEVVKHYFLKGPGAAIGQRQRTFGSSLQASPSTIAMGATLAGRGSLGVATSVETHTTSSSIWDGPITCWYDSWSNTLECEGVTCSTGGNALRATLFVPSASALRSSASAHESATLAGEVSRVDYPIGIFLCNNGCEIYADGTGWLAHDCPDDGEGGDEDPPEGGGGSGPPPQGAQIQLVCSDTAPIRGTSVSCSATISPSGSTATITLWSFEPDNPSLGPISKPRSDTVWEGVIVASGRIVVDASAGGADIADTVSIAVRARQNFGSGVIPMDIPAPITLPATDADTTMDLGEVVFEATAQSVQVPVSDGPNEGYIFLSGNPKVVAQIAIASNAFVSGAPFYQRHPLIAFGGYCTRQFVGTTLPGLILAHEGSSLQSGSHTQRYSASLQQQAQDYREISEAIVMSGGGSDDPVIAALEAVTSQAFQASSLADTQSPVPLPNCTLRFRP